LRGGCYLWQSYPNPFNDELVSVVEMKDPLGEVLDAN
jgi:hypothetical protein